MKTKLLISIATLAACAAAAFADGSALDCSTIVYRGQLELLSGDGAATNAMAYVKTMHFRVYDDAEAATPLWKVDNVPNIGNKMKCSILGNSIIRINPKTVVKLASIIKTTSKIIMPLE